MQRRIVKKTDILSLVQERQKASHKRFAIKCTYNSENLFIYRYPIKQLQIVKYEHLKAVTDVLDRCGIVDLRCEYYPSRLSPEIGVKYDSTSLKGFDEWFQKTLENKQEIFIDTNMIIYHTLSRLLFKRIANFSDIATKVRIPRLVLLELEAKYNREKEKLTRCLDGKQKLAHQQAKKGSNQNKKKVKEIEKSEEEHRKEIRLMLSVQTEVQILKRLWGQTIFSTLNPELLAAYYTHAGKGSADPFIRREIIDATGRQPFQVAFLTRDLMNALTASAENLDTFYFSHATPNQRIFEVDDEHAVEVMIETAITFGRVWLNGLIPGKYTILEGMWSTKSNIDWIDGRVILEIQ